MRILVDRHIPWVQELFGSRGELVFFDRTPPPDLARAEALLVRSTLKINAQLFSQHQPRFVGTATAGTDHLDLPYLAAQGIRVASAPGCNGLAVAQWVIAGLVILKGTDLKGLRLGIVGLGQVGRRLAALGQALGMEVRANDPPAQAQGQTGPWETLEDLLGWAEVVSLHVPWTTEGPFPTYSLLDHKKLALLRPGALLVNSCRGGVVEESALLELLPKLCPPVIDTWAGEPQINRRLLNQTGLASPHVAGYSEEAKAKGTWAIAQAFGEWLGLPPLPGPPFLPPLEVTVGPSPAVFLAQITGIDRDNRALKAGGDFAQLRNQYPFRREWQSVHLQGVGQLPLSQQHFYRSLGFVLPP
ncbi:MAG: hypothetical protein A2600_04680 [Candidatus Lambdaproteobacteria bacterium RIFOXYD1_FULL_56_27]|uniref:Erythronate-4-phosphate dehydrogenase n=1 Tax=Candidatus Lambdaproteobacteria bacterium RIFOXYD2_FULL_56_26 TaxID=1817773 RepID=A0A1F6H3Z6_9PROT|nr:MAG: hypothetical protein A2557_08745 [Candidatus Lambdaproteobacteria bacterium RIFOXYD2_FULL_56_26]OGH09515.1 MAG: hypothetical protein A2600_04680 [Candidatus Lambdaproteobacteria bacterium RIFOXYD1_FULL_56_27]